MNASTDISHRDLLLLGFAFGLIPIQGSRFGLKKWNRLIEYFLRAVITSLEAGAPAARIAPSPTSVPELQAAISPLSLILRTS
jgi:hypothetical protein